MQKNLEQTKSEGVSRGGEEGQVQEADLHGGPSLLCGGGDKRGLGEQAQSWALRRQRLGRLHIEHCDDKGHGEL